MKKMIIAGVALAVVAAIGVWFFVFYKPTHFKRDVADEKGIVVAATAIVNAYVSNEAEANKQFLNKAVEVTGEVMDVKKDQEGKTTVALKGGDAFSNVFCTLKETATNIQGGTQITIKGVCTGFLSDVVISDAVIVAK